MNAAHRQQTLLSKSQSDGSDDIGVSPVQRRRLIAGGALAGLGGMLTHAPSFAQVASLAAKSPAADDDAAPAASLAAAIEAFTQGAPLQTGRVSLELAPLIDNGNAVPVTIRVDSPMTQADHVRAVALFAERNPQHEVVRFALGPRSGRAWVSTRIRLATSQTVVAVARLSDGSAWVHRVAVVVTLAACIEGES